MAVDSAISELRSSPHLVARPNMLGALLLFYWAYLYVRVLAPPPEESSFAYALTVIPVALGAALSVLLRIGHGIAGRVDKMSAMLVLFLLAALAASLPRSDLASVRSAGLIVLTLIWLGTTSGRITVRTLNYFFVASIVAGAVWFLLGLSEYGLLPGQYAEGSDRGIEWRVSLFPFVPESGFFALIVLLANQLYSRGWARWLLCGAALYFLIFSGVRSALLALVLCEGYFFLRRRTRSTRARFAQVLLLLVLFAASVIASSIALLLPELPGGALGNYLFRTDSVSDSEAAISQSVYRGWLWLQHVGLFMSSPVTGVGTIDLGSMVTDELMNGKEDTGSESFLTGWLARLGLCFLPVVAYLLMLGRRAAASPGAYEGAIFLILGVATLAYGSFLVPYNFMFLLLFRSLLQTPVALTRRRAQYIEVTQASSR